MNKIIFLVFSMMSVQFMQAACGRGACTRSVTKKFATKEDRHRARAAQRAALYPQEPAPDLCALTEEESMRHRNLLKAACLMKHDLRNLAYMHILRGHTDRSFAQVLGDLINQEELEFTNDIEIAQMVVEDAVEHGTYLDDELETWELTESKKERVSEAIDDLIDPKGSLYVSSAWAKVLFDYVRKV